MPKPKTSTPKVTKSRRKSVPPLCAAVREVRLAYGDSQQRFAERLGTSLVSVNRWELGHQEPAALSFLALLRDLAGSRKLEEPARLFAEAVERFMAPVKLRKLEILVAENALSRDEEILVAIARISKAMFPEEYKALMAATPRTRGFVEQLAKSTRASGASLTNIVNLLTRPEGDDKE